MVKASANVVFSLAIRNRFWFDYDQRIDILLHFFDASLCDAHPVNAFELKRFGHDTYGQDAVFARQPGNYRSCTSAGAPPIPAVMNTM